MLMSSKILGSGEISPVTSQGGIQLIDFFETVLPLLRNSTLSHLSRYIFSAG
jgi:hypothetical protein